MRTHPCDARAYAELKYYLAHEFGTNRHGYIDATATFIWASIAKADEWAQAMGWLPNPSPA